jgi:hypothetical protein
VGRSSQALFPAYPFMNTIPFQVSHNQAPFSGSIPMLSSLLWTRVLGRALLVTVPRTVNSGTSVATRCGPNFTWSDFYLSKLFPLTEQLKLRFDTQFFNVFNHPNFGLPSMVQAGIPGKPTTQTGFGSVIYTTSPPTGLLGVGLGGDSTPRMIAFQLRLEF